MTSITAGYLIFWIGIKEDIGMINFDNIYT